MDRHLSDRLTAKEALKANLKAIQEVGGGADQVDAEIARNILKEDLGEYSGSYLTSYGLEDDTRDRLIAHARQDAAHSVVMNARILKEIRSLRRVLFGVIFLLLILALRAFT